MLAYCGKFFEFKESWQRLVLKSSSGVGTNSTLKSTAHKIVAMEMLVFEDESIPCKWQIEQQQWHRSDDGCWTNNGRQCDK